MKTNRERGGAAARQAGDGLERRLHEYHEYLRAIGVAHVLPRHPEAARPNPKNPKAAYFRKAIGADYAGFMVGGRGVVFDAKSLADGHRFPLSLVRPAQDEDMQHAARMGLSPFFFVEVRSGPCAGDWLIWWCLVDEVRRAGKHASIELKEPFALRVTNGAWYEILRRVVYY